MQIETKVLQAHLLEMLKQFHAICEQHSIVYYIAGGTMLGAIRHKGFIPWDDDVDVVVPRNDYEKLKKISQSGLPGSLEMQFYETKPNSPVHYMKLVDSNTTLVENKYRNYIEGVYIDVFPLDGGESDEKELKKHISKCNKMQSVIMNHCYTNGRSGIRKIYGYYAKMRNLNKLHKKVETEITRVSYDSADIVGNIMGSYGLREMMPKKYFGKPVLYPFEDTMFYGPEKSDEYLRHVYGDYMKLPPLEARVNTHQYYYVSLSEPYREYNK